MSMCIPLLIVDDDRGLCELLSEYLSPSGFGVDVAHNVEEGVHRALQGSYALAILDVMLPGGDGFQVLRQIRARSKLPILMLTARGEEVDRIVGLEIGADDYLPKPFNPRELAARLQAILRRSAALPRDEQPALAQEFIVVGDVQLDTGARVVSRGGRPVDLTGTEFTLLEVLLRSAGRIVSRHDLGRKVLGRRLESFDRSIDMHVSNVRKKLGPGPDHHERIRCVRRSGYIYVALLSGPSEMETPTSKVRY